MRRNVAWLPIPEFLAAAMLAAITPATAGATSQHCDVTVGVDGTQSLGALELRVGYGALGGSFVGTGDAVDCVALASGAYQLATNDSASQQLDLGLLSVTGVALPSDLWRCSFETSAGIPSANGFVLTVDEALDPDVNPIPVTGQVSSIVCDQQAVCGNGIVEAGEQCDTAGATVSCDASCKLTANSQRCQVGFHASGGNAVLGGIQFDVDYGFTNGSFDGSGVAVQCTKSIESALTAVSDEDAQKTLRLALISPGGIALPVDLWQCTFTTDAAPLQLETFQFHNVVATDLALKSVAVSVVATSTSCTYGPYCGDGHLDAGEICDDGNRIDTDACTNACKPAACGDGITHAGVEQCDDGNSVAGDCCSPACTFEAATTVCRAAAGICDQAENCTGTSGSCPADAKRNTVCRASGGFCDIAEVCSGTSNSCPPDVKSTAVCRASTGICDLTESCTGSTDTCPADHFQPATTACTSDGNACTDDRCDGSGSCAHPSNSAPCDDGLFCNGTDSCQGGSCSMHSGNPCPGPDGDADCSETCSESQDNCNGNDPDGSACNDGNSATTHDQCLSGICVGGTGTPVCGDADGNGTVTAGDALKVLRFSVGQGGVCPLYLCDTDRNGSVTAGDALKVLKKSVGQSVVMNCPAV